MTEPKKKRRKRKKSSWQLGEVQRLKRERLARKGEAWPVYESLLAEPVFQGRSPELGVQWDKEYALLYSALQRRAHDRPDQFAAEVLARIMSSAAYLWARSSFHLERCIQEVDVRSRGDKRGSLLDDWDRDVLMPRVLKLGEYIGQMAHIQAATARQWALTREKLHQNNEEPASQPARRKRQRVKKPAQSPPVVDGPIAEPTNGTAGVHPPTTAISISDPRVAEVVNEGPVHLPASLQNRLEPYLDGSPTDS